MHTIKFKKNPEVVFLHNGDFSGDVKIIRFKEGEWSREVEVPFDALVSLVAKWARDVKIAKLEDASEHEILGLPK
jgi:hypothetical protein